MPYVEKIKIGTGEAWPVRDSETASKVDNINEQLADVESTIDDHNTRLASLENSSTSSGSTSLPFVEMNPGEGAGHGGYIDFHFGGSAEDYTSRIVEWGEMVEITPAVRLNKIVLTAEAHGPTLPAAGTPGRLFFKKV